MANPGALLEKTRPDTDNPPDQNATANHDIKNGTEQLEIDTSLEKTLNGPSIDEILTKRERQILEYIIAGHTNKEIAQKLYRTQRTVEYHRNRLMRKLDTHTTAELVKRAILMGIA